MIEMTLNCNPISWSPSRISKHGAFNPKGKKKAVVQWLIKSKYTEEPIQGYVVLEIEAVFPRTQEIKRLMKKTNSDCSEIYPTKMDCTNVQKFVEDCCKNILFEDDRNVVKISCSKVYGDKGKIDIRVYPIEEYVARCGKHCREYLHRCDPF